MEQPQNTHAQTQSLITTSLWVVLTGMTSFVGTIASEANVGNTASMCSGSYWHYLAITNVYILYKSHSDHRKITLLDFQVTLAKQLIGTYCSGKKTGRPSISGPSPIWFREDHFLTKATCQHCHYCYHHNHERHTTTCIVVPVGSTCATQAKKKVIASESHTTEPSNGY